MNRESDDLLQEPVDPVKIRLDNAPSVEQPQITPWNLDLHAEAPAEFEKHRRSGWSRPMHKKTERPHAG